MRGGGRGRGNDEFQPPVILPVPEDRHSISNTGDTLVQPYLPLLPHTHPTSVCLECPLSAFPVLTSSSGSFPCYSVRHQTQAKPLQRKLSSSQTTPLLLQYQIPAPLKSVFTRYLTGLGPPGSIQSSYFTLGGGSLNICGVHECEWPGCFSLTTD